MTDRSKAVNFDPGVEVCDALENKKRNKVDQIK